MRDFQIDFLETYDEDAIVQELKRIATANGKETVTKADIDAIGCLSYSVIYKRFGSLRKALEKAELKPQRFMNAQDGELLEILVELWERTLEAEGRRPLRKDLKIYGYSVSGDTYLKRFGSWKKALILAYQSTDTDVSSATLPAINNNLPIGRSRENLSLRKRFIVLKRDEFSCRLCGASGHGVRLEVDHIFSFAKGGTNALDNLQTLCFDCNRGKRDT